MFTGLISFTTFWRPRTKQKMERKVSIGEYSLEWVGWIGRDSEPWGLSEWKTRKGRMGTSWRIRSRQGFAEFLNLTGLIEIIAVQKKPRSQAMLELHYRLMWFTANTMVWPPPTYIMKTRSTIRGKGKYCVYKKTHTLPYTHQIVLCSSEKNINDLWGETWTANR